jgi:hypothetical protein
MSMFRIEQSRAYVLIVVAGVVYALSPLLAWAKAYNETPVSLVHVANASSDQAYIPWVVFIYGVIAAVGATRRSIGSYVIILVTSVGMLVVTFYGAFSAMDQAYGGDSTTLYGAWVGFGALALVTLTSLVSLLRI